ncbi:hypothetical protein OO010_12590 [Flavobacteriaceae bacterium KMM 6898]|nr:hypothetical protein [Flavobacteriaceae bacterium KMM 6898]
MNKVYGGTRYHTDDGSRYGDSWYDKDEDCTYSPGDYYCKNNEPMK